MSLGTTGPLVSAATTDKSGGMKGLCHLVIVLRILTKAEFIICEVTFSLFRLIWSFK